MKEIVKQMRSELVTADQVKEAIDEVKETDEELKYTSRRLTELEQGIDELSETHRRYKAKAVRISGKLRKLSEDLS